MLLPTQISLKIIFGCQRPRHRAGSTWPYTLWLVFRHTTPLEQDGCLHCCCWSALSTTTESIVFIRSFFLAFFPQLSNISPATCQARAWSRMCIECLGRIAVKCEHYFKLDNYAWWTLNVEQRLEICDPSWEGSEIDSFKWDSYFHHPRSITVDEKLFACKMADSIPGTKGNGKSARLKMFLFPLR